jgi:hypothetical protein
MTTKNILDYRKQMGLCTRCEKPAEPNKKMCLFHLDESAKKSAKRRKKLKNKNLCIRCGQPSRENKTTCINCKEKSYQYNHNRHIKRYYSKKGKNLCIRCGKKSSKEGLVHCDDCNQYMREKDNKRHKRFKELGICAHCGHEKAIENEILCLKCKEKNKKRGKNYRDEFKEKIINYYGKVCRCCGESNIKFLEIDHIDGGGNQHQQQLKSKGTTFYRWLWKNKPEKGFQVLCSNCNRGRYRNGGICPHQDKQNGEKRV